MADQTTADSLGGYLVIIVIVVVMAVLVATIVAIAIPVSVVAVIPAVFAAAIATFIAGGVAAIAAVVAVSVVTVKGFLAMALVYGVLVLLVSVCGGSGADQARNLVLLCEQEIAGGYREGVGGIPAALFARSGDGGGAYQPATKDQRKCCGAQSNG